MGRREALRSSAATAGLLLLKPETVFGTAANSAVELGLIGCGNRGLWIASLFVEHTGARFVALADVLRDRLELGQQKLNVAPARSHLGFNAYHELISSKVDGVVIETPPYFHAEMVKAAVATGKHVFIAKPVAVDVPGCMSIQESGEKAKGKLSFLVDFQIRVRPAFQEAVARVHRGDIGAPILGHVFYHATHLGLRSRPGMPPAEARLRDWYWDRALSGDVIVERDIHVLDGANWYLRSRPVKAYGTGGRKAHQHGVGDCWNHFIVTYWYPDEVKVDFSSAEFTRGYRDLCVRILGSAGTVDSHYGGAVNIHGDNPWQGTEKDDTGSGAIANAKDFIESIRTGKYLNNVAESVESNLTAILGRMAAFSGRVVTWEEMLRNRERYELNLKM
ncbi:MAG: Gfo/Idh/MocA family oxidoreductase [Acidobacteriota bacterium]